MLINFFIVICVHSFVISRLKIEGLFVYLLHLNSVRTLFIVLKPNSENTP